MEMQSIIGALNEGADIDVLEEKGGVYYLKEKGKKKITYVRRQIDSFLLDSSNIADYLAIVGTGQKSEYDFNKRIMDCIEKNHKENRIENKFIDFLSQNSERIMDIARTTGHTGMLILTEMSAYIRQFCLEKGYISAENRRWKVNEDVFCQARRRG